MPESSAAARTTSSHMSRGSGASTGAGLTGRHVRWATPMRHGVRGSTAIRRALLALPDRRALLGEGLGTFFGVLGLKHRAADLLLEVVGLFEVEGEAAQHALLGGLHGERRVDGDPFRPLTSPLHGLVPVGD